MSGSLPELSKLRIERAPEPQVRGRRRRPRSFVPRAVFLLLLGLGLYLAWPRLRGYLTGAESLVAGVRAVSVRVGPVVRTRPGADLEVTTATGYVVPREKAALAAKVAGTLITLRVDVGDRVEMNSLIGRIDPRDWEHARDRQAARAAAARTAVSVARIRSELAKNTVARLEAEFTESTASLREMEVALTEARRVAALEERLHAEGSGLPDNVQRAVNDRQRMEASAGQRRAALGVLEVRRAAAALSVEEATLGIATAESESVEAQAALAAALTDLDHTEIRAPFAGVVLRKEAEVGEIVVPALAGGATSRGAVVTLAAFDSLELEVDVFERDIRLVVPDGPVDVLINAFPDLRLRAKVRQIVPTADRTKGTVQVKVTFLDRDPRVLPEMAGKAVFLRERPSDGASLETQVWVPANAVVDRGAGRGVFLVESDRVRFRLVDAAPREGDRLLVSRGLSGGEQVVLDPPTGLRDGDHIKSKEDSDG